MNTGPQDALIARLLELPPAERAACLKSACEKDPRQQEALQTILDAIEAATTQPAEKNLGSLPGAAAAQRVLGLALEAELDYAPGSQIGNYKLLQKLGEGGFGVVWMAEQQQPIRRRVALKIIKLGMDTKEVIARFEAERQALALMEHPNIARVFDAGATENGRPYFAMELVRGVPITRYCDGNRLSAEARLRLFILVCQAVQHAHQKGVIHRDLKPSNIFVTLHDGVPVPKVIDFGIAKATSAHLTDKTLFTQFHAFIGTPAYTSPEQMEMSGLDVDTRSDIYSLGVLLYELLTGQPPFDPDTLAKSGLEAMRRTIREIDPPRPSQRLGTLSDADRTSVAQQRGTDSSKLSLLLRGDLDWIVMRCLEKDRTRRYETANGLAVDVQRHLANETVAARPPSGAYRLQKFIRRHRVGVAAATAVAVAVIGGLLVSSALFVRERTAHRRALAAEQQQGELRRQAESARVKEVKRAARTSLDLANRNLTDGRVADGLAYLVYAARKDPLNSVLAPRLASVLASHNFILPESAPFECGSRVVALRYALDGRSFMAGTEDGTMRVYESATGKVVREFRLGKPVWWLSGWPFARANDEIFAARFGDNSVAVYAAATGRQQGATIRLDPAVRPGPDMVELSPDGRWILAYAYDKKFWVWDAATGEKRFEQPVKPGRDINFDFSADGRRLSVAVGDEVGVWSLPDFLPVITPFIVERPQEKNRWLHVRFFSDSRRLAICDSYAGIQICDTTTGALLGPRIDTEDGFASKAWQFSPDGRLLHVGSKTSEIRDLTTGRLTSLPFSYRDEYNWDKNFSRDGSLLLTTLNGEALVNLWDTKTGKTAAEFTLRLPTSIRGALSPDGTQIVVGTAQGSIYRLRVGRGIARPLVLPRPLPALPLAFLPEAPTRLLWLTRDRARVLDVASGREVAGGFDFPRKVMEAAPGEGSSKSALRADLKFLVVRNGSGWEAWQLSTSGVVKVVPLRDDPPKTGSLTLHPTADLAAIETGGKIRVWNLLTGACVGPTIDSGGPLWQDSFNFSPNGRRVAAACLGEGGPISIWDVATGKPVTGPFDRSSTMLFRVTVQFSPDGTRIVTADRRGEARLWDTATGAPLSPVFYHTDVLLSATFSPDGLYVATRSSTEARVWDARTAVLVGEPLVLPSNRDLQFSPDSRRFVTVSQDGNARIFDVRTAQAFTEPMNHGAVRIPTGFFSPDGLFVRTETTANDFRLWSVPPALPDGAPPPEWLLQLATACAGKVVNDDGQLTAATDIAAKIETLRAQVAALPADAPLADWGRWVLNDRADRSIAPGFTFTPAEADQLAAALAAANPTNP